MGLIDRAKNIMLSPKTEWPAIAAEQPDAKSVIMGYVLPMAAVPAVAAFIGYGFIGVAIPFFGYLRGINWGLMYAIQHFILTIAGVLLTAFIVDQLAGSFASQKNFGRAVQLISYSYTPSWVAGILLIYPSIGGILAGLIGLYGIYLLYLGFPHTMQTPQDKVVIYMIVAAVVLIVIYFLLSAILSTILLGIFGLSLAAAL